MTSKVAAVSALSDLGFATSAPVGSDPVVAAPQPPPPKMGVQPESDLRLVIEESAGSYVYKTIDRLTGNVIAQYPRDELLRMQTEGSYSAGGIVSAKA